MTKLEAALAAIGPEASAAFDQHLRAGTPATYLSNWLARAGHSVSATSIKEYRGRLRDGSQ